MITQEQLTADKAALDAATAKLDADQKVFDALQPHLSVWAEVEAYASKYAGVVGTDAVNELTAIKAKGLALLEKLF